jgi:acyl-CoA thioesterase
MSSLAHTVVFHANVADLKFGTHDHDWRNNTAGSGWFCKEDSSNRCADGRVLYHSKLWSPDGVHIATVIQDGLVRLTKRPEATPEESRALKRIEDKWPPREKL